MSLKHTFNEEYRLYVPINYTCEFCESAKMETLETAYKVPLYGVSDSTNIVVYKSVSYQIITVLLSRCKSCKAVHDLFEKARLILPIVLGLASLAILYFSSFSLTIIGVVTLLIAGLTFFIIEALYKSMAIKNMGSIKSILETSDTIQESLNDGWTMVQPRA